MKYVQPEMEIVEIEEVATILDSASGPTTEGGIPGTDFPQ